MTAVKVQFEIGHEASIRTKKTPEGFTHDWEVFVRGQEGADISIFVEKVVFHLHETFPKPKRVVREPPFSVKESGYAGFNLPIEIYVKNKDEPKKIKFNYDLNLPQTGPATYNVLKDRYIFQNPNEDFKRKLLSGGGIVVNNNAFYTNPDQETRSRDSFTDEKQLLSKPKLSTEAAKKHKAKEHKEIPHKTNSFENLFGLPIQKPPKISPDPKKLQEKSSSSSKNDKKDKDRSSDKLKQKYEHKESKPEKIKVKEDKDKSKDKPSKSHSKDSERSKDKSNKRLSDRALSPELAKKRCLSPPRKLPSPQMRSSSASSINKEDYKSKMNQSQIEFDLRKVKMEPSEPKVEKESKERRKKEKKSHDRDKERKEKKEHKKDGHKSSKESPKEHIKEIVKEVPKSREVPKEKEILKEPQMKEKPKPDKSFNKFSIENLRKTPQETQERLEDIKPKEKSESERKHKHKKKDKKRDESREKHKESSKEKKHKHDKVKEAPPEKLEILERRETPVPKEKPPEPISPHSLDTASQCSSKSGVMKPINTGGDEINSSQSESEEEAAVNGVKMELPSPEPVKPPTPAPEPQLQPPIAQHKEKSKKHKDKSSKREEKRERRKRKAAEEEEADNRKATKASETLVKTEKDCGESSTGATTETKLQDNGVSSSLGEDAEELSPGYMEQLRELQQRIMTIKSNEELDRVVNLIAETGRYEVTTQTFDFDLCLLDRATVQQLIQLVG